MEMDANDFRTLIDLLNAESKCRDSITISTPSKGGEVKVYFDSDNLDDAERRICNAIRARAFAQREIAKEEERA